MEGTKRSHGQEDLHDAEDRTCRRPAGRPRRPGRGGLLLPIREAAELTNIGILLAFVVVCVAVIVLRY
ncbi:hypothetical protein AB0L05_42120, partial [Nonomuraea pusilla]